MVGLFAGRHLAWRWNKIRNRVPELTLLALASVPRVWAAWNDQGVLWADEIYQSVEQAHRLVFGVGMIPWEFRDGARSWIFPGVLAGVLKVASFFTATGLGLMRAVKLFMVAVSIVAIVFGMRIAHRVAGRTASLFAGALIGGFPALVVFSPRAMSEMASGAMIAGVALLALGPGKRRTAAAGLLGGIATFMRVQNGVAVLALLLVPLLRRRWREALGYSVGGIAGTAVGAAIDWMTWGKPYHSIWTNLKFNLVENRAVAGWGASPWSYYFATFWTSTGWPLLIVAAGLLLTLPRAPGLVLTVGATLGAHVAIQHKEYRFVMPIVPLALALAGAGLAMVIDRVRVFRTDVRVAWIGAAALGALLAWPTRQLTQAKMGYLVNHPNGQRSVWHHDEERNLALAEVSARADACGVAFPGMAAVSAGGYSYLHKKLPVAWGWPETAGANYYISTLDPTPPPGYQLVRDYGEIHWLFRRDGSCTPMPIVQNM